MKTKRNQAFSNKLLKALVIGGVVTIAAVNPFFGLLAAKVVEEELKKKKWKELKKGRLALLAKLRELRFIMLQKSIWAHPFECQNEVTVLARAFEVDKYVQHLVCSSVSASEYLKREFEKRNNTKLK